MVIAALPHPSSVTIDNINIGNSLLVPSLMQMPEKSGVLLVVEVVSLFISVLLRLVIGQR